MQPIPIVACFGEFLSLLSSSAGEIHVQSDLNLELGTIRKYYILCILPLLTQTCQQGYFKKEVLNSSPKSKTFHFFALINSLTELTGCFGSLFWCNMQHFPMNLVAFSWILVGKMGFYPSKFILPLSSYIESSVKLIGPVPDRQSCMPMPWHHLHHALQMRLYAWDLLQIPFFSTLLLSRHLVKGSSLSHWFINTIPKLIWLTFLLFL